MILRCIGHIDLYLPFQPDRGGKFLLRAFRFTEVSSMMNYYPSGSYCIFLIDYEPEL